MTEPDRSTAVIIPVKAGDAKTRLSSILGRSQRRQLQIAMLEDTLQTLARAKNVGNAFVVSSDSDILDFVERFGARALEEPGDSGVNSAVYRGLEATSRYERRLVIPADLPLLSVQDLRAGPMMAREGAEVVLSPSETFDGTNMLLLKRGLELPLHYDDDSFRKHLGEANRLGLKVSVYSSIGVGFDIDKPSDVHRFFKYHKTGSTRTYLGRTLRKSQKQRSLKA